MNVPSVLNREQLLAKLPAVKPRTLKEWLAKAKPVTTHRGGRVIEIPGNGLERALIRKGRLVFFKEEEFMEWFFS